VDAYRARCAWSGSTAVGVDQYDRAHAASAPPAKQEVTLTSGEEGRGSPDDLNPEQLLVMAASSCQLLWFLYLAARARIDVVEYVDEAEGVMPPDDKPLRITEITLRPRVVLRPGPTEDRLRHLTELAHRQCYIANSLKSEVRVEPRFEFRDG
jgi:organic hydroperoxide reductase OsmC/OhrA